MKFSRTRHLIDRRGPEFIIGSLLATLGASLAVSSAVKKEDVKPSPTTVTTPGIPTSECANRIMRDVTTGEKGQRISEEEKVAGPDNTVNLVTALSAIALNSCRDGKRDLTFTILPVECASIEINGQRRAPSQVYVNKQLPNGDSTPVDAFPLPSVSSGPYKCKVN